MAHARRQAPAPAKPASQEQQAPKTVVVDGKEADVEAAARDHLNRQEWQRKNTQRSQELSAKEQALAEKEAQLDQERSAPAPRRKLPDPVDDGDQFNDALDGALNEAEERAVTAAEKKAEEVSRSAADQSARERARERIGQQNLDLLQNTLKAEYPDMTETERREVDRELRGLGGPSNGAIDPKSGAYIYNEAAVHKAVRAVDSYYKRQMLKRETAGYEEGLEGRTRQRDAMLMDESRPAEGAADTDMIDWLRALPADLQGQEVRRLTKDRGTEYTRQLLKRAGYSSARR